MPNGSINMNFFKDARPSRTLDMIAFINGYLAGVEAARNHAAGAYMFESIGFGLSVLMHFLIHNQTNSNSAPRQLLYFWMGNVSGMFYEDLVIQEQKHRAFTP